ncbi:MAG: glucose-6-phosphate isomerase [Rhodocyclaceae bacterium]|nr:glucose-6-phosphate isomerase [Rhodocyclaceae bacterium]
MTRPSFDTHSPAWRALEALRPGAHATPLAQRFAADADRAARFSATAAGLTLDYSKNALDEAVLAALVALAAERQVDGLRDALLAGERINRTENRAVLHMALRAPQGAGFAVDGVDVMPAVVAVRERMLAFAESVRSGEWTGHGGEAIRDVVNIGIGGSDLGPRMACEALAAEAAGGPRMHFVSNVDGHALAGVLDALQPETTLFVIASKTFTTLETMRNADSARAWLLDAGLPRAAIARHFVAVSTHAEAVSAFGIDTANMFGFWDWVGGRFSMWSAVGLSLAIAVGEAGFRALLDGAHQMDRHFAEAPLAANLPVLLALVGLWNRDFLGYPSLCIAPYAEPLARLPAYLQQLEMESNGKSVRLDGEAVGVPTCPVIWGEPGTNGQHAFFQLLHQGTDVVPVDFILPLRPSHGLPDHHRLLLANGIAQSKALMVGRSAEAVRSELAAAGRSADEIARLVPHRTFAGNRPSNTILLPDLSPRSLGALIALYEHKVFVQGALWGINSFDQWGVELGKQLAGGIADELAGGPAGAHDGSTAALIARAKAALDDDAA